MDLDLRRIREAVRRNRYSISPHALIEAKKDGLAPETAKKLEYVVLHGKVIEEYPDRHRGLFFAELPEEGLPVHVVLDYSFVEEPAIVTAYVPDERDWIKFQIRKKKKGKRS